MNESGRSSDKGEQGYIERTGNQDRSCRKVSTKVNARKNGLMLNKGIHWNIILKNHCGNTGKIVLENNESLDEIVNPEKQQ